MEALLLIGTSGLVRDARFVVEYGRTVTIGRSRRCDVNLNDLLGRRAVSAASRDTDRPFRTVSRRHVRIRCFNSGYVELENLGRHGTQVDGVAIDRKVLTDLRERTHTLRLGLQETFEMQWVELDERDRASAMPPPA
jgi:pSer/pThr/pTyr-binding forkhead associated (FHA) protein